MKAIQVTKEINAAPEAVFKVFSDLEKAADRITDIIKLELLTDGPVGKGTRWRETRIMFKKESTEEMEITRFDPPNGYTAEAESHGSHYTTHFDFTPKGEGTEVKMVFEAKPLTLPAKIMTFLTAPMMRGMVAKCFGKEMSDLKAVLEKSESGTE